MKRLEVTNEINKIWSVLAEQFNLNEKQMEQFYTYSSLLQEWNKKINLTTITDPIAIIKEHFQDSLMISHFIDFSPIMMICDIGTGAGFPSIPLKICYPHLIVVLIEVSQKKILFLEKLIDVLRLENVLISPLDWRTFLRKTRYDVDLFLARASISVDELIRMFKPACYYRNVQLVYWASRALVIPAVAQSFVQKEEWYKINGKRRRYIFFQIAQIPYYAKG